MEATDKENSTPSHSGKGVQTVVVTEEQRARITDNFRSAKSLVDRKRPFQLVTPSPTKCRNAGSLSSKVKKHQDPPLRKLPLSETRTSCRLPSFDLGLFGCGLSESSGSSCERSIVDGRIPLSELSANCNLLSSNAGFSDASAKGGGCLVPAEKESHCSDGIPAEKESHCSDGIGVDSLKSIGYLDDELDESILKEIDEICEHTSVEVEDEIATGPYPQLSIGVEFCGKNVGCDKKEVESDGKGGGLLIESSEEKQISSDDRSNTVPQAYIDYWQKLNDQQREASCSDIDTPLVIMAGPGSGKTSTMVGRVLMLLKEGIHPRNILAMTFTTAAASEMRDRIGAVVGKSIAKEIPISTFHSFSLQLCRLHAEKLGRTPEFFIYGHGQQRRAIIEAIRVSESQGKGEEILKKQHKSPAVDSYKDQSRKWEKVVTKAKASGKTPDDCIKRGDELGATIFANYNDILRSCNALDYHDFIICSVTLLTDFPEVYKECQSQWKAIVVDEFQDTSLMQYKLLKILSSHKRITVIGDDDQSIFSFNGADVCAFDSFHRDFPIHKEVRLSINYRSTRCIVDAASSLIRNNNKRCQSNDVLTYNSSGDKITVKECHNESAQCAFVVDKIMEITSDSSIVNCFGKIAVLYRRQATGKAFQVAFRERKIPFNIHGTAFYRKKVIKAILGILRTTLPSSSDASARQAFKALLVGDKEEKKKVIDYVEKISVARKCSFHSAACDIFQAKVSGTFRRTQLLQGRKVLSTLDMLSKLVCRERSITTVVSSVASMIPQKYLLEKRAVVDVDSGKYLNEEHDLRSVLQYLLDDVSEFLSSHFSNTFSENDCSNGDGGCSDILEAFLDYISSREAENYQCWKRENENSVTLTTIHQSKGLEWDTVFIVKVNESEIPLLNESMGIVNSGATLEEERRLLYVAITRARKNLYILYVLVNSNWQFLQPSRFLKEIPKHLTEGKSDMAQVQSDIVPMDLVKKSSGSISHASNFEYLSTGVDKHCLIRDCEVPAADCMEHSEGFTGNSFLKRFNLEERQIVSHIFHQWAKKPVFQNPKRLLDKVGFVIDERLRNKANKNKDVLRTLKSFLGGDEAFQYAERVLRWQQIPADKRAHLMREKQEHFQKLRIENAMGSSGATAKQISYLQMLGCTVVPASRLHASNLIEQYKSL